MTLSKIERDVLELVRDQHAETRMGTPTHIVHAGLNARSGQTRGRITDVLLSMSSRGLLISRPRGWVPSKEGALALDDAAEVAGEGSGQALPEAETIATVERIAPGLSAELLDRCAAMHLTLLRQAKQSYEGGNTSALSDLQWLRDTGRQLIAAGGEHA